MRYRQLDPNGDYVFGYGPVFLVNTPATVGQAVLTRLRQLTGEWFLDLKDGLDTTQILGYRTQVTRDRQIQQRILGTPGVTGISAYGSSVIRRAMSVSATIDTVYGQIKINEVL